MIRRRNSFFLILFLPSFAIGADLDLATAGRGIETLMGGVGVARLGSNGAMLRNPSLFAWLNKKKEFISTNTVNFYKFSGVKTSAAPQVVPIYAVSTEGFGDWGHGYGLTTDSLRIKGDVSTSGGTGSLDLNQESIGLNYGAGKKLDETRAIGISLGLMRFAEESKTKATGSAGGGDYLLSSSSSESVYVISTVLGYTQTFGDDWAVGVSSRQALGKFGHRAQNETTIFSSLLSKPQTTIDHSKSRMSVYGNSQIGLQRRLSDMRLFLDYKYAQPMSDSQGEQVSSGNTFQTGFESPLQNPDYRFYGGVSYNFKIKIKGSPDTPASGQVASGLSYKGKHSLSYVGLSYYAPFGEAGYLVSAIMGTKFEY